MNETPAHVARLRRDMAHAVRSLIGSGYVAHHYFDMSGDFVGIAQAYAVERMEADRLERRHRPPNTRYRFVGRSPNGELMAWESVGSTTGDSRVERIAVSARRFWGRDYPPPTSQNVASPTNGTDPT